MDWKGTILHFKSKDRSAQEAGRVQSGGEGCWLTFCIAGKKCLTKVTGERVYLGHRSPEHCREVTEAGVDWSHCVYSHGQDG